MDISVYDTTLKVSLTPTLNQDFISLVPVSQNQIQVSW